MTDFEQDQVFFDRGLEYLVTINDIRPALTNVVRSAAATLGSDCGSLYLLQRTTSTLEPFVLINIPDDYLAGCSSVPLGAQCCGRAALHRMPWAVADMWTDPLFADCAEAARQSGMRAGFSVPVMVDEECVGTLAVQFRYAFEAHQPEVARLSMFSRLVSLAIQRDMRARNLGPYDWVDTELAVGPLAA